MASPHVWVSGGSSASKSVIHMDAYLNQHCVLKGRKRFMLIPPMRIDTPEFGWVEADNPYVPKPKGFEDAYGAFFGHIDPDDVDLESFPKWKQVPWFYAELNPGDCIYMPYEWFHYVESDPEITVTWHHWFNLEPQWRESDVCENGGKGKRFSTDSCAFSADRHGHRGRGIDWKSLGKRLSVCGADLSTSLENGKLGNV